MLVPLSLLTADPQTTLLHSVFSQWTGCGEEKNMWASCHTVAREHGEAGTLFCAVVARGSAHVTLLSAISGGLRMQ